MTSTRRLRAVPFDVYYEPQDPIQYKKIFRHKHRFSSPTDLTPLRLLLALAAKFNMDIYRMSGSYGKSKLEALEWKRKLTTELGTLGFMQSRNAPTLYFHKEMENQLAVAVYGRDILLVGDDINQLDTVRTKLGEIVPLKELGGANGFLGLSIKYHYDGIEVSLKDYIMGLRGEFEQLMISRPTSLPAYPRINLRDILYDDDHECDAKKYRSIIRKLQYAAYTVRYDICYIVLALSNSMEKPKMKHMNAALSVLRYIIGSSDFFLSYTVSSSSQAYCYSNANFGSGLNMHEGSLSGNLIVYGAPISWDSKAQSCRESSSMSESIALAQTMEEAFRIMNLLSELRIPCFVKLLCENCPAIELTRKETGIKGSNIFSGPEMGLRVGNITLDPILSAKNCAHLLTSLLCRSLFTHLVDVVKEHQIC